MDILTTSSKIKQITNTVVINGTEFVITDFKIATYGCDDTVYANNPDVWSVLPRGCTNVNVGGELVAQLRGLPKFGYMEDPFQFDLRDSEHITTAIYTEKENGECFHVSSFTHGEEKYWLGGSKNVHCVLSDDNYIADLDAYNTDRYGFCKEMMASFYQYKSDTVFDFLDGGRTLIAESCSLEHQHIVDYSSDRMVFFACRDVDNSVMSPIDVRSVVLELGLTAVEMQVRDYGSGDDAESYFRTKSNSEGCVLYLLTSENRVHKIVKLKNERYVLERAVREKMRARSSSAHILKRVERLHVPVEDGLLEYFLQFNAWCRLTITDWPNLFDSWVSRRKEFDLVPEHLRVELLQRFDESNTSDQVQIMFVGFPGSGKSSISKYLLENLSAHMSVWYANQDQSGNAKKYHREIAKLSTNGGLLLLDKCNHTRRIRANTLSNISRKRLYIVELVNSDLDALALRIKSRGLRHRNLLWNDKLPTILSGFANSYEPLTEDEVATAEAVIRIDNHDLHESAQTVVSAIWGDAYTLTPVDTRAPVSVPLYWSICIDDTAQLRGLAARSGLAVKTEFHITLSYKPESVDELLAAHIGSEVEVEVTGYLETERLSVAQVQLPSWVKCNRTPHVTLSLGEGVSAVESGVALEQQADNIETVESFVVSGRIFPKM